MGPSSLKGPANNSFCFPACDESCKTCSGPTNKDCVECEVGWARVDGACVGEKGTGWKGKRFFTEETPSPPERSDSHLMVLFISAPLRAVEGHS